MIVNQLAYNNNTAIANSVFDNSVTDTTEIVIDSYTLKLIGQVWNINDQTSFNWAYNPYKIDPPEIISRVSPDDPRYNSHYTLHELQNIQFSEQLADYVTDSIVTFHSTIIFVLLETIRRSISAGAQLYFTQPIDHGNVLVYAVIPT
jgi:hypothetical protein